MQTHLSEFQQVLLRNFKYFDKLCQDNNITYYAHGGSCLGAIRHQGFIPWDDDLDVLMPRKDYEHFIQLADVFSSAGYGLSYVEDKRYKHWLPFAKFFSMDCTVWERRKYPLIISPWIDIFPIDQDDSRNCHSDLNAHMVALFWNYYKSIAWHPTRDIINDIKHNYWFNALLKIFKSISFVPMRRIFLHRILSEYNKIKAVEGDSYRTYGWTSRRIYKKEWFGTPLRVPFEDAEISIPHDYDAFLTFLFGDYMQLPPQEERHSVHKYYYINLKKKLTVKQIETEVGLIDPSEPIISFYDIINNLKYLKSLKTLR